MTTEDDLKQFLADNKESIAASIKERMIAQLIEAHRWSITDELVATVQAFMKEEVMPEVRAHLQSEKGAIIAASIAGASQIGTRIAEQMVETASKNIAGYQFRGMMESLFK